MVIFYKSLFHLILQTSLSLLFYRISKNLNYLNYKIQKKNYKESNNFPNKLLIYFIMLIETLKFFKNILINNLYQSLGYMILICIQNYQIYFYFNYKIKKNNIILVILYLIHCYYH